MSGEPNFSVNFISRMLGSGECAKGDVLVYDTANGGWLVATSANRTATSSGGQAIAITAWGSSIIGQVSYQASGIVAQEISELPVLTPTNTSKLVRTSATGTLERVDAYTDGDDIVGYAYWDGRVALHLGLPWQLIASLGGQFTANGDLSGDESSQTVVGITNYPITGDGGIDGATLLFRAAQQDLIWQVLAVDAAGVCYLETFGTVHGDGVTSDQAVFDLAIAAINLGTYSALVLGARTYLCPNGFTISRAGVSIVGQGDGTTVKMTKLGECVQTTSAAEDLTIHNLIFEGSGGATSTPTAQTLLKIGTTGSAGSGLSRARITNVTFKNSTGKGFHYEENPLNGVGGANSFQGPYVQGCRFVANAYGFYCNNRGEYVSLVGCQAQQSTIDGFYIDAGNTALVACWGTVNARDLFVGGSGNNSHSHAVACKFNHSTKAIRYEGTLGFRFVACEIYGLPADSISIGGTGFVFDACQIDVPNITSDTSISTSGTFRDCEWGATAPASLSAIHFGARIEFLGTHYVPSDADRPVPAAIAAYMVQSYAFPSDADQVIDQRTSSAEELILTQGSLVTAGRNVLLTYTPDASRRRYITNNTSVSVNVGWKSGGLVSVAAGETILMGASGGNARVIIRGVP